IIPQPLSSRNLWRLPYIILLTILRFSLCANKFFKSDKNSSSSLVKSVIVPFGSSIFTRLSRSTDFKNSQDRVSNRDNLSSSITSTTSILPLSTTSNNLSNPSLLSLPPLSTSLNSFTYCQPCFLA